MKQIFEFLSDLEQNNTREWFTENKLRYQESLEQFRDLATSLIAGISSFDPTLVGIDAKQSIFRIYKDVRFSKDKLPYKTHFGCWMTRGGENRLMPGTIFTLSPGNLLRLQVSGCHRLNS